MPNLAKIKLLADLLKQAGPDEIELAIAYLSGTIRQAKVGVGWATLQKAKLHVGTSASLQLRDVDAVLEKISTTAGKGSAGEKQRLLAELFASATAEEQDFLFRLLTGELRQGALEGIMVEALAQARELPAEDVRRAVMLEWAATGRPTGSKRYAREGPGEPTTTLPAWAPTASPNWSRAPAAGS